MFRKQTHIHFVGIGGIGMSGIAEVLLNLGHLVSGSDLKESDVTRRLASLGARVFVGHKAENVAAADVVVISSAVPKDNPEILAARRDFTPVIPRAEMLAELMRLKYSVAVAGSHGKTTTTSLVGTILGEGALDPTMVIGGKLDSIGSNARLGQGEFLVAEADESDGSFLLLSPTIAVVTNIDLEHLDYYRDLAHIKETFLAFINKVPFYGTAVVCLDDPNVQGLIPEMRKKYLTYGLSTQADIQAAEIENIGWGHSYELVVKGEKKGRIQISLPGRHNVLNSLAAVGVGLELKIPMEAIARALAKIGGIHRRFHLKGEAGGVTVIDDYGHHPTEIKATLAAMKECYPNRRLVVLFQPHRYSRTEALFEDFCSAFNQADKLITTEIYPAGEAPRPGIDGKKLADAISSHGHHDSAFEPDLALMAERVVLRLNPDDVVLTLGAGNIFRVGEKILEIMKHGA
ncbi:MAG: UDP-N-acetylmuramate--L-alanine ligase [Pseudomonadota bacterium]